MAVPSRPLPHFMQGRLFPGAPEPVKAPSRPQAPTNNRLRAVPEPAWPGKLWEGASIPALREKSISTGPCLYREIRIPKMFDDQVKATWMSTKRICLERGWSIRDVNGSVEIYQYLQRSGNVLTLTPNGQKFLDNYNCAVPFKGSESAPVEKKERLYQVRGEDFWRQKMAEMTGEDDGLNNQLVLPSLGADLEALLFDYQVKPARQLLRALQNGVKEWGYPGALDGSDLGTGKTFQAAAAAKASGLEVCIICPLAVIGTFPKPGRPKTGSGWRGACAHLGIIPRFICNYESLRTGKRDWVKMKRSSLGGRVQKWFEWTLPKDDVVLIFDEAHNGKNVGTLNQALFLAAARQGYHVICVSGTIAQDPRHLHATGLFVGLHGGRTGVPWEGFLNSHGVTYNGDFVGGAEGRYHLTRINKVIFPRRGARTKIIDLGDRFPETTIMAEAFETGETSAIQAAFRKAKLEIEELEKSRSITEEQGFMLRQGIWMKAWHAAERLKVPALVAKAQEEIENGQSVALFVNFSDVRKELMERLGTQCTIFGGQTPEHRNRCIAAFQADESRIIIPQIDAGGVGISLHDLNGDFPRTSIILPTSKVVSLTQALGRVHRAGGKTRSRQIIFFAAGTLEEDLCDRLREKQANMSALNDGSLDPTAVF